MWRVDRNGVEQIVGAVTASKLKPNLEQFAFEIERVRSQQTTVGVRNEQPAVVLDLRDHRCHTAKVEIDGAGAVCHLSDDFQRRPQPARA